MTIGAKLLNGLTSINGRFVYSDDGQFQKVPGNGAYVAISGNLMAGGKGSHLRYVEAEAPTGADAPDGVICFRQIRLLPLGNKPSVSQSLQIEIDVFFNHPLPAGLTNVGGNLYLEGYTHPLPAGLTNVGGYLTLQGYAHPLPAGLKR